MDARTRKILQRIDELARISEEPDQLTRTFGSSAMRRANDLVAQWMNEAGLKTGTDAIGNVIGRPRATWPGRKTLLLGSHLDTVRNAGKYDGPLGVILAVAAVEEFSREDLPLPFDVAVIGFADEEGVRYQTTYLGSGVMAGTFDLKDLERRDAAGISLRDAIRAFGGDPENLSSAEWPRTNLIGYLEAHIEQGPVLEVNNLSVGVVTTISGQSRLQIRFLGRAGHAGTTPMHLRADALCAAAEFILAVEARARKTSGLVATVGRIQVEPGAGNVIPGAATLTLTCDIKSIPFGLPPWLSCTGPRGKSAGAATSKSNGNSCNKRPPSLAPRRFPRCSRRRSKNISPAVSPSPAGPDMMPR